MAWRVRASINGALPYDTLQRSIGTLSVVHAGPGPVIISEVKLRHIAMQMFLATVLIHAPPGSRSISRDLYRSATRRYPLPRSVAKR